VRLRTIIFDFDGTLAHLNIDFSEMRRRVLALFPDYGLDPALMEGRYLLEGIEAARHVMRDQGEAEVSSFEARAEEAMVSLELEAARESFLLPGVPEALLDLKARGLRLGIITRNSALAVESILSRGELVHDLLLSREDVGRARVKPNPDHLERALQRLEGIPQTCLMVGDHPLDIRVAKRVGTYSAGVLSGRHQAHDFEEEGADLVLEGVKDLSALFDRSLLRAGP